MQSSRVLALQALTSKIHPQLPLNPRESQQLLNLLTTSFRRQLEKQHPQNPSEDATVHGSPQPTVQINKVSKVHAVPSSQASVRNVLQSILSNPLVSGPRQRSPSPGRTPSSSERNGIELRRALDKPVEWFEDRIAQGTSSMDVARVFMASVSKLSEAPENAQYRHRAAKVLREWLWATGCEDSLDFVRNDNFTKNVVHLLVANGLEKRVWEWTEDLDIRRLGKSSSEIENKQALLLVFIANTRMALSNTTESALTVLFDALERKTSSSTEFLITSARGSPIARLYHYLRKQIINGAVQLKDVGLFERFLRVTPYLANDPSFWYAQLMLMHPSVPDTAPALSLIRMRYKTSAPAKTSANVKFLLNTAQVLLSQENYSDATWVMSFTHQQFSEQLDLSIEPTHSDPATQSSSPSKAEIANLELLNGLSPG